MFGRSRPCRVSLIRVVGQIQQRFFLHPISLCREESRYRAHGCLYITKTRGWFHTQSFLSSSGLVSLVIRKMVKLTAVAMLVMGLVAAVLAAPASEHHLPEVSESAAGNVAEEAQGPEEHLRFRRVTCDLLSAFGDAACAANCLSMGKAGGSCHGAICVCRTETFKELWDKRFG